MTARYVLGIHAGHNASAAIADASGPLFAVQEERPRREKNYWGFPRLAIRACLERVGARPADLAAVVYGSRQVFSDYRSREDVLTAYRRQGTLGGRLRQRLVMPAALAVLPRYGQRALQRRLQDVGLGAVPLVHHDHHHSHAATAYYGLRRNPDERYLVLTCDGDGDGLCATVRVMGGGEDRLVAATPWANSLGTIYSWITFNLGFVPLEHEYKLMGMAPYAYEAASRKVAEIFRGYLDLADDGLTLRRHTLLRTNDLGRRMARDLAGMRFDHVCGGLQLFTEDLLTRWAAAAVRATGCSRLLAAGGVFMNVKANQQIAALPEVESFEAFPSCGDETLPLGACYLEAAKLGGEPERLAHFYLGGEPGAEEIETALAASGFPHEKPEDMAEAVAELLAAGKPVARCAGRMEFGARALGNRSILADPSQQDVVRVINQMIKKRDFWMPFAPMILDERQHEYIENPKGLRSPYMMMTFDTRANHGEMIAAVHNADLTCRAQILRREQNPAMHAIVEAFARRTGRGVVLNTSFNLHGFPIVQSAADALQVFADSGLEHLQLGDWLVSKAP
ncbi:MAG: carbamoyltransferase [Acidobacteria bacterium]|nr:carbamoyltransferase [Acidobacteriota bacterium]